MATDAYLIVINTCIGCGKAVFFIILANLYKSELNDLRVPVLLIANYLSLWITIECWPLISHKLSPLLYDADIFIFLGYFISFIITTIVEWPFYFFVFKKTSKRIVKSLLASFTAQEIVYLIILVPYFMTASDVSLFKYTIRDRDYKKWANNQAILYYISSKDGDIYRLKIHTGDAVKIKTFNSVNKLDYLFAQSSENGKGWDLYAKKYPKGEWLWAREVPILSNLSGHTTEQPWALYGRSDVFNAEYNAANAADLRESNKRVWDFSTSRLGGSLIAININTNETIVFRLEAPFAKWDVYFVTVLPMDQVIFQLGPQICIFDRETRRIGLVAEGRGPVVFIERNLVKSDL